MSHIPALLHSAVHLPGDKMQPCSHSKLYLIINWLEGTFGAKKITQMFYLPGQTLFSIEFLILKKHQVRQQERGGRSKESKLFHCVVENYFLNKNTSYAFLVSLR